MLGVHRAVAVADESIDAELVPLFLVEVQISMKIEDGKRKQRRTQIYSSRQQVGASNQGQSCCLGLVLGLVRTRLALARTDLLSLDSS